METTAFDLAEIQRRLGEAIAWYLSKAPVSDPEYSLRTAALTPRARDLETSTEKALGDLPAGASRETVLEYFRRVRQEAPQVLKERQEMVDVVAEKRRALLKTLRLDPPPMTDVLGRGRLLTYNPDENLTDGAAPLSSARFFDDENIPPWDTWLAYVEENILEHKTYLLAWVPPEFLELASAGIEFNPEHCILWAEDVDAKFVRQLRAVGLLR
jgi:hypothetical protein